MSQSLARMITMKTHRFVHDRLPARAHLVGFRRPLACPHFGRMFAFERESAAGRLDARAPFRGCGWRPGRVPRRCGLAALPRIHAGRGACVSPAGSTSGRLGGPAGRPALPRFCCGIWRRRLRSARSSPTTVSLRGAPAPRWQRSQPIHERSGIFWRSRMDRACRLAPDPGNPAADCRSGRAPGGFLNPCAPACGSPRASGCWSVPAR